MKTMNASLRHQAPGSFLNGTYGVVMLKRNKWSYYQVLSRSLKHFTLQDCYSHFTEGKIKAQRDLGAHSAICGLIPLPEPRLEYNVPDFQIQNHREIFKRVRLYLSLSSLQCGESVNAVIIIIASLNYCCYYNNWWVELSGW